jgi:arylsulfatase A-like enzyme
MAMISVGPTMGERALNGTALVMALILGMCSAVSADEAERPDIIVVIVDALRPDHMGCYGYERPTSPNIDGLASGGIRFEDAITQAPWTKGSLASMFTSLYPFQHGATTWSAVMPESQVTLAEVLSGEGYQTMCVINMLGMAGRFQVLQGFDRVSAADKYERLAPQTTDDAIAMLADASGPYFLVVHYYDSHAPYRPPLKYVDMIRTGSDPDLVTGPRRGEVLSREDRMTRKVLFYDGCIRYVDEELGRLLQYLDNHGARDRTLVVVTADHGEALGERGIFGHGAEAYDDAIKVPLVLSWPDGFREAAVIADQVRHIDLMPTILEIVGCVDNNRREGATLLPLIEGRPRPLSSGGLLPASLALCDCTNRAVPGKIGLRSAGWKIIKDPVTSLVELYDLRNDPGETRNLWGSDMSGGDSLLAMLQRVPTVDLAGWRLVFTGGDSGAVFRAYVSLPDGGRFTDVGTRVRIEKNIRVDIGSDSTYMLLESQVGGAHVIHFDTRPAEAKIAFSITGKTQGISDVIRVGTSGAKTLGESFEVVPSEAYGLPDGFAHYGTSDAPAAFLWYLTGSKTVRPTEATRLTPEERKRLKALGYIQ